MGSAGLPSSSSSSSSYYSSSSSSSSSSTSSGVEDFSSNTIESFVLISMPNQQRFFPFDSNEIHNNTHNNNNDSNNNNGEVIVMSLVRKLLGAEGNVDPLVGGED